MIMSGKHTHRNFFSCLEYHQMTVTVHTISYSGFPHRSKFKSGSFHILFLHILPLHPAKSHCLPAWP